MSVCFVFFLIGLVLGVEIKVGMVTLAVGDGYLPKVEPGLQSKREYCQFHNYSCVIGGTYDRSRPAAWSKIPMVRQYLPAHDFIFFSDADCVILNPYVKLESFIPLMEGKVIMLSNDTRSLNTGNFFIRNCPEAFRLLDEIWNQRQLIHHTWHEQMAFMHLHLHNEWVRNLTLIVQDQNLFNAYIEGHFLIHFAGYHSRMPEAMKVYDRKRTRLPLVKQEL